MRSERTSGMLLLTLICPALAAALIGESGGTYHTIGRVRYSGWSGNATFHSIAIFHTGEWRAASSQFSGRSEEHTSELQSLMRISYAVFCLKKKNKNTQNTYHQKTIETNNNRATENNANIITRQTINNIKSNKRT